MQTKQLISVLLNTNATVAERDDAAMLLGEVADRDALDALLQIATNRSSDEVLLSSCGESIGQIINKNDLKRGDYLPLLPPPARREAEAVLNKQD